MIKSYRVWNSEHLVFTLFWLLWNCTFKFEWKSVTSYICHIQCWNEKVPLVIDSLTITEGIKGCQHRSTLSENVLVHIDSRSSVYTMLITTDSCHCFHRGLSKCQLKVQPVMTNYSTIQPFCFRTLVEHPPSSWWCECIWHRSTSLPFFPYLMSQTGPVAPVRGFLRPGVCFYLHG